MEKNNLIENAYMALLDRGIKATESDYVKRGLKTSEQRKAFDNRVKMVEDYARKHPGKLMFVMPYPHVVTKSGEIKL